MQRKPVTIADVAAAAGVSKMTVSNVLSSKQSSHRHVSEQTRQRVLTAVQAMKYSPNANALSLRRRRTNIIGFYSGYGYVTAESPFLATILGGLQEACDRHQKDLLLHGTFADRAAVDIYAELIDGRIDGLVLYAPANDPLAQLLADSFLPVVALADAVPVLHSVLVDDCAGSRLIVEYLAMQGHRHILYHCCTRDLESTVRRLDACREASASLCIQLTEQPTTNVWNGSHITEEAAGWLDLPADRRPTAAVCWNDLTACDLLEQCERRGIRVPAEIAVVGYDGLFSARGMRRRLTTIRAPWAEV